VAARRRRPELAQQLDERRERRLEMVDLIIRGHNDWP
jgi:hypothetical protein